MTVEAHPETASRDLRRDLRTVALFATLSESTLAHIAERAVLRTYASGEHIQMAGDRAGSAYFILEGEVRVYRVSLEGREQVLVRLEAGQAFNTVPIFQDGAPNPANVSALTEVTLCVLLRDDFRQLTAAHPDLAMALLEDFADRLAYFTDLVEDLALHTVQERLARFLLARADEGTQTTQRWTQQEIAVHLGTVRDVVGRELRSLEDAGVIRIQRGQIVLLDRDALTRLARR